MEPLAYLKALRQWWWLCVGAVIVAAAAAYLASPTSEEAEERVERDTRYEATHTLFEDETAGTMPASLEALELLTTTGELPLRVAERLGWDDDPARLVGEFNIDADHSLGTLRFTAIRDTPSEAEHWADTYAEETRAFLVEQGEEGRTQQLTSARQRRDDIDRQIRELEERIDAAGGEGAGGAEIVLLVAERDALTGTYRAAVERLQELEQEEADGGPGMVTLQAATAVPVSRDGGVPISVPNSRWPRVGAASAIGLVVGLGLVLVLDRVDTRIRTRRAAERAFAMPVIAEIPRFPWRPRLPGRAVADTPQLVTVQRPASEAAESFRMLRLSLQLMERQQRLATSGENGPAENGGGHKPASPRIRFRESSRGLDPVPAGELATPSRVSRGQVVLVTSAAGQDGKTTAVVNLAAVFAEIGHRVLVLDCDLRKPELHVALGQERAVGITDALEAPERHGKAIAVAQPTDLDGVSLIQAGFAAEQPFTAKRPDRAVLDELRGHADVVIIDSGPALSVNDPTTLMPAADAVIVVARSGRTTVDAAERMSELLGRVHAPVLGVALNAVPSRDRTSPRRRKRRGSGEPALIRLRRTLPVKRDRKGDTNVAEANGHGQASAPSIHGGQRP